jgi:hypothetical protein
MIWLTCIWLFFGSIFLFASNYCVMASCVDGNVFVPIAAGDVVMNISGRELTSREFERQYPSFEPFSYSLDLLVPLLDLGTESLWRPNTSAGEIIAFGSRQFLTLGGILYALTLLEEAFGSLLIAFAVAGFTGLLLNKSR